MPGPSDAAELPPREGLGMPLAIKLTLVLVVVAAAMIGVSVYSLGPRATEAFLIRSGQLIEHGGGAMQVMAQRQTTDSCEVISDLIRHTADSRRRLLHDLPLSLYAGDVERLRAEILARDARRSVQLEANVALLTREMQRRSQQRIDDHVEALHDAEQALSQTFAETLRHSFLTLTAGFGLLVLVLLGLGLHAFVIRPIRALSEATTAVAEGELPPGGDRLRSPRWRDEVDALSDRFHTMVEQLGESRREVETKTDQLEALNTDLQLEVERQSHQLVQAAKMASIGTLAGGIAHEFNNLIGGIQGCTREALADPGLAPGIREPLEIIDRATHRATHITRQLRRFAQKQVESRGPVALDRLLTEVLELSAPQARRQNVELERDLEASDLVVHGDASGLHQVFLNLVTNALQAMPEGGRLTAVARRSSPHGAGPGDSAGRVEVTIADTGTGIAAADLEHVFEPFFTRKADAVDPTFRGSGLGLSVSYGIVTAHGGQLDVHTEPGRGTSFITSLPIGTPDDTPSQP